MQAFGIEMMGPIPFFTLSAGQQRLVLLARALVKNPPLLILDEPCQGLDDLHTRIFIDLLDQLCRNTPITLIYVTHYQGEIPSSMTHQLVLEHGRVVNYGPL
jgi:molybdate transport system ATP-binding protein